MGKSITIDANRSETIISPKDAVGGDDSQYSGYLIHVSGGNIKLEETRENRSASAQDGVTVADGTTFSLSARPLTAVHAFADGSQVTIEVTGFHRSIGEFD